MTALHSLVFVYFGLVVFGALLTGAERQRPALPPGKIRWTVRVTDVKYWIFTPIVTGALTRSATMGVIGLLAWSLGYTPRTGLLPIWLQAILSLLIADIIGYWSHRLRHTPGFWKFHVIHHAPVRLDWLAAARMHPVDDIVDNTLVGVPILLLGFDLRLFAFLGPVLLLHTLLVHANVRWNFGPLRWVFVSPALHRWHHARDLENRPRNFAGMFAFVDWIFGTFYLPAEQPVVFGTLDENLPDGLSGQLVYPFSMLTLPTKERP